MLFEGFQDDYYLRRIPDDEICLLVDEWKALSPATRKLPLLEDNKADCKKFTSPSLFPHDTARDAKTASLSPANDELYPRHYRYIDYTIAYEGSTDPFEGKEEAERNEAFQNQCRFLRPPFVPGGRGDCSKPTRMLLGDCVRELYGAISQDWIEADPILITTSEDLIVLFFSIIKPSHRDVLHRYMNGCLLRNATCRYYGFRKVSRCWNLVAQDGSVMFALRPYWVPPHSFLNEDGEIAK